MAAITVEIDDDLLQKAQEHAAANGFSSFSGFLENIIQARLAQDTDAAMTRETTRKMEELGYIDAGLDI